MNILDLECKCGTRSELIDKYVVYFVDRFHMLLCGCCHGYIHTLHSNNYCYRKEYYEYMSESVNKGRVIWMYESREYNTIDEGLEVYRVPIFIDTDSKRSVLKLHKSLLFELILKSMFYRSVDTLNIVCENHSSRFPHNFLDLFIGTYNTRDEDYRLYVFDVTPLGTSSVGRTKELIHNIEYWFDVYNKSKGNDNIKYMFLHDACNREVFPINVETMGTKLLERITCVRTYPSGINNLYV